MEKQFTRRDFLKATGTGLAGAALLGAAGCGGAGGGASGSAKLSGARFTVGSKEFTEEQIFGELTKQVLENAGASVTYNQLGGTTIARDALTSGRIDMYWEYTGTAWIDFLKHTKPIPNSHKQFEAVAKEDLKKNHIKWLSPPAPENNTYALAVRSEAYNKLGVKKLSDLKQLVQKNPSEATVCGASEFLSRPDGLPGLEKAYGFKFPQNNIAELDEGAIYEAVDKGKKCNFGEVFTTDGRIQALHLKVIKDNKHFFPIYNPALNVREDVYKKHPQLEKLFAPISKKLTTTTMQKLNAKVDVKGQLPETVAKEWLSSNGFI